MSEFECANKLEDCSCHKKDCIRHGICCECVKHHRDRGGPPNCLRKKFIEMSVNFMYFPERLEKMDWLWKGIEETKKSWVL